MTTVANEMEDNLNLMQQIKFLTAAIIMGCVHYDIIQYFIICFYNLFSSP